MVVELQGGVTKICSPIIEDWAHMKSKIRYPLQGKPNKLL